MLKLSEIERVDRPIPKLYDTEEYVAAKGGFSKSVRYLNNDLISELY